MNHNGQTPLHIACFGGQYEVVKFLLENSKEKGIDVTKKTISTPLNMGQKTAEDYARDKGHQNIVDLFEAHREPNQPAKRLKC